MEPLDLIACWKRTSDPGFEDLRLTSDLAEGESRTLRVAYFAVPAFQLRPVEQRYTGLHRSAAGGRYRFESLSSGQASEIGVDRDGQVVDYPGLFRRVEWPGG